MKCQYCKRELKPTKELYCNTFCEKKHREKEEDINIRDDIPIIKKLGLSDKEKLLQMEFAINQSKEFISEKLSISKGIVA